MAIMTQDEDVVVTDIGPMPMTAWNDDVFHVSQDYTQTVLIHEEPVVLRNVDADIAFIMGYGSSYNPFAFTASKDARSQDSE
jgi:hypothetical protein